jgi:predicted nuclease with TOPRIM domain
MKYKISKAEYEALDAVVQALYKAMGDDFVLVVEGLPTGSDDLEGLRNKVETLLTEKKEEKRKRDAAEAEQRRLQEESQRANGEYEQLYTSSQQALEQERTRLAELTASIERRDLTSAASKVSNSIADGENAEILAEFVQRRLKIVDGQVKVTDAAGNLTIASLEDLAKEFQQAPRYAALVRGTQANGGGAAGGKGGGATKTWDQMTGMERVELRRTNPAEHARMKAAAEAK